MNNRNKGILFAVTAAIISGISIFYNKLVVVKGIDPLIFNILKNGGVAIILSALLVSQKKLPNLFSLSRKQWGKLWIIAIIGGSIPFILYFDALRSVSAINATLIQKTLFIWVAMMAIPLLGERLTKIQIIGYLLIVWSNLFIGGFSGFSWSRPELMILIATMLWSIENIVAKISMKDIDQAIVTWARMFLGGLLLIGVAIYRGKIGLLMNVSSSQLLLTTGSIILLTAYVSSWYRSLSLAPATLVTSILVLATPITNLLSAVFITHTFPLNHVLNLFGTLCGLILIAIVSNILQKKSTIAVT